MKTLAIINPIAGKKRKLALQKPMGREEIEQLLKKYEIEADIVETKKAGDGTKLAQEAVKQKYKLVIACGGDGTVEEMAMGLAGTQTALGIIPLGTFMNMARMLGVPREVEKAIEIIKIGRTRKIDVGKIREIGNYKNKSGSWFFETCGVGLVAEIQERFTQIEKGRLTQVFPMIKAIIDYYTQKIEINIEGKIIRRRASLVEISNGPRAGAVLEIAPDAKLNDHRLTVSIFKMGKWQLLWFFIQLMRGKQKETKEIERMMGKWVEVNTRHTRMIHADDHWFGRTPARIDVVPNGLKVLAGFSEPGEEAIR